MKRITLILAIVFAMGIIAPAFAVDSTTDASQRQALLQKYQERKAEYLAAKEQYTDARQKYVSAKNSWTSARNVFLNNKNDTNATQKMIDNGKNYLTKIVDNRIRHLELVKVKVENMSVLSDAEKNSILSELNTSIAAFNALKPEITAVTTKDGFKTVAAKIKAVWKNSRRGVARAAGTILSARELQFANLAENVSSNLRTRIEKLNAAGRDTSAYGAILSQFDAKIASAKQDIESAKAKFTAAGNASTPIEKEALIKEGNNLLKSAHEKIKEAHELLKNAIKDALQQIKDNLAEQRQNKTVPEKPKPKKPIGPPPALPSDA